MKRGRFRLSQFVALVCLLVQCSFLGSSILHLAQDDWRGKHHTGHPGSKCPGFDHVHVDGHVQEAGLVLAGSGPHARGGKRPAGMSGAVGTTKTRQWHKAGIGFPCPSEPCLLCSFSELLRTVLQARPPDVARVTAAGRPVLPNASIPTTLGLLRPHLPRGPPITA